MNDSVGQGSDLPSVVFFGTPEFAVPALEALAADTSVQVSLVVTQPDRPAGRKRRLQAPPVKVTAEQLGLPVLQPETLRDPASQARLLETRADLFIVSAYGRIFGKKTLALPRLGCINLHASLLPAYRGASPIAAAILNGDERTGVSLMRMKPGLDTGPVLATIEQAIKPDDTTASLTTQLADRAAELLQQHLGDLLLGKLDAVSQSEAATETRLMIKEDGRISWEDTAEVIERHVRAMWPWPRAWTTVEIAGEKVTMQVHRARVACGTELDAIKPGSVTAQDGELVVQCGAGTLVLNSIQLPGGRPQPFDVLMRSAGFAEGLVLGEDGPTAPRTALISEVIH